MKFCPEYSKSIENALSQRIEEDDLPSKKIRVNAQVTFVISI